MERQGSSSCAGNLPNPDSFEASTPDLFQQQNSGPFGPQNPFSNPYILEMLLSFLPIVELQNCLLISKNWNKEIRRFLAKTKSVTISGEDFGPAENLLLERSKGTESYLSQVECTQSNLSNPVFDKLILRMGIHIHKLVLIKCEVNVNSFQCLLLSDPFPFLHTLILTQTLYVDTNGRHTLFILDEESPSVLKSLQKLEINERGPTSTTSLKNIAIMCPNLKTLTYGNCPPPDLNDYRKIDYPSLNRLEYMQLAPIDGKRMNFQYFDALIHMKMKSLKSLFLYGMDPGGVKRIRCLKGLLVSVSSTLETLHLGQRILYTPEYKSGLASPFPVSLPNLKRMSLGPGFVNSMKFFNKVPNLVSFCCSRTKPQDWTRLVKKGVPNVHENIKLLDLGDINHIPLQILGPVFPNVVRVEMNLSRVENHDEIVRTIFGNFPKLQIFCLYDLSNQNRLTDSGITGILNPNEVLLKGKSPEFERVFPYIGDMKCLIDLRLQYLCGQLTDASVELGVKHLLALYALDLSNSQITDASLDIIGKCCSALTMLYVRNCSKITNEGIAKFKEMRKNVHIYCEP